MELFTLKSRNVPYATFKFIASPQQPIFIFTSVRSLHSFYLFLSLRSAIRFSNQCHTFVKRKFFHHRACEIFVTFDGHVLTAVRNFDAESIHCRRILCPRTALYSLRLRDWLCLCAPSLLGTAMSIEYNYARFECMAAAMMRGYSTVCWQIPVPW
jgi:hypothetical protein